ncbi:LutC/YkgG family protein [Kitasatospora viridis]|uniref:L-lactate dehydrogenase complex protein LldG n=1 Tax=Kitasatospora viridis TaxID=281105 RepID=A0A561UBC6_9ACTN|nr:lactate utilization protein C [Kitasatospora viridis]TWF96654.1 L-lactate dehydrogenase complex protein LldG [Kitasatospora viridis]
MSPTTGSRERVLARIRTALADHPEPPEPTRGYRTAHAELPVPELLDLLAENLADYRAVVHRSTAAELPATLAELLKAHGSRTLAVPADLPDAWTGELGNVELLVDGADLTPDRLERTDTALTGCALAIAETGTIVLDAGAAQGRRRLTLVPDHHICVIRADQVVAAVPQALPLLDPARPQTWISGPSATSDIELERVEGVHGPRRLDVVILAPQA